MTVWIPAEDVQAWIGPAAITLDDAAVLAQIASDAVQSVVQRDLSLTAGITDTYDTNGTNYVLLNYWPIRAIAAISLNGQAIGAAGYQLSGWKLDPVNTRKVSFPGMGNLGRGIQNLTVSGLVAGYDVTQPPGGTYALPANVYQALRLTAAAIFNSQAADPNLTAESTAGVFSGSFAASGVGAVPPGARTLLLPEMRVAP